MLAAHAFGAPRVIVVDVDKHRLSFAKHIGADEDVQVSTDSQLVGQEVLLIKDATGCSIHVTFDCVGFNKTMLTALNATHPGGKVRLIGLPSTEMTVTLMPAAAREMDVIGICCYRNSRPLCIDLLRTGKIDVKPLATHRFGFSQEEIDQAFETSSSRR